MYRLILFGAPTLEFEGHALPIPRRKAQALLAYLAVTQQPYTREALATLFWPDYDTGSGRADLSRILSTLRKLLTPGYFQADHHSVALNPEADLWVDVVHFRHLVATCRHEAGNGNDDTYRQKLAEAADLYRADFLAGFTLPGCPDFDEWQLLQTEALRRDLARVLDRLVATFEAQNALLQAITHARRRVTLDPLHEPAQRQLIALYLRNGQRAEAHRQYESCVQLLAEELGVEPHPQTKQLYDEIRRQELSQRSMPPIAFTTDQEEPDQPERFVLRDDELARLGENLQAALAGEGHILFITGSAGRGKTSLLREFARRSQEKHPQLVVANGKGNAFGGIGDPYLPFREVLDMLGGNVGERRPTGQMSVEQARRLWALLPLTAQSIVERGPQLLELFVSGKQLLERATAFAPAGTGWLEALREEVARRRDALGSTEQSALFGQFTGVLQQLATKHPLLLTLDDLQWFDAASTALLFHLGRSVPGSPILIVGAYRPDELAQAPGGEPHRLVPMLDEFKRIFGDIFIDLAEADRQAGAAFIHAYVDSEPNRLDDDFRQALFEQTAGHPMFTVELLRDMQSRGDLLQDEAGQWRAGPHLDWKRIPARVEGVIARRIERLDEQAQAILTVASVEGEQFTAEIISRVLDIDEQSLLGTLAQQLGKQQRLVQQQGETEVDGGYLSLYKFAHILFQQYLYRRLDSGQRRHLHHAVAQALAELYTPDLDRVAVPLSHHLAAAGRWAEALPHLERAGDLARERASLDDAAAHFRLALEHSPAADREGKARMLRKLGECKWMLGRLQEASGALEESHDLFRNLGYKQGAGATQRLLGRVYWEMGQPYKANHCYQHALTTLQDEPESEELGWALAGLATYHMHIGDYDRSIELGEEALALARRLNAEELLIQCLCDAGSARSGQGDWDGLALERESLTRALALNRPHDAGRAYLYLAEALIYLGRYEEARSILQETLTYTRRTSISHIAAAAARFLAELDWLTGNWSAALEWLETSTDDATPPGEMTTLAQHYRTLTAGHIYNDLGQGEPAHRLLSTALSGTANSLDPRVALLGELARCELRRDQPAAAIAAMHEILEWTDQAPYLYPNIASALLTICRAPLAHDLPAITGDARYALQQLQRLDAQYSTPATAASLLEAQGYLALSDGQAEQATGYLSQAAAKWQDLGHPYDQARALSTLSQAQRKAGDNEAATLATEQASQLFDNLGQQLPDPELEASFVNFK